MIRHVLHSPEGMAADEVRDAMAAWREAGDRRQAVDVALAAGFTVERLNVPPPHRAAFLRRARARVRRP